MNFDKERFLKYYRWIGRIHRGFGTNYRAAAKFFRAHFSKGNNWNVQYVSDKDAYVRKNALHRLRSLYRECKDDEARAWRLWQRRWPEEEKDLQKWLDDYHLKATIRGNLALASRPPLTFGRVLAEIDRAIERQRANAS